MTNNKQQTEINAVEYLDKVNQFAKGNNTDKPKQQTAIEWLYNELLFAELNILEWNKSLEQAKEMFQGQIEKAYDDAIMKGRQEDGEQYYNETYGGNKI